MTNSFFQRVYRLDTAACLKLVHTSKGNPLETLMRFLSRIGNGWLYPLVGILVIVLDPSTARAMVPAGCVAYLLALGANTLLKRTIRRLRPCEQLAQVQYAIEPQDRFSFPSGHSASAFLCAALVTHYYPAAAIPVFLTAGLIGFSRIYNGVHYPSDVIAGTMIGMLSVPLGLLLIP